MWRQGIVSSCQFAWQTLRKTLFIGGLGPAAVVGLGFVSLDLQTVTGWVQSGSAWADENLEGRAGRADIHQ